MTSSGTNTQTLTVFICVHLLFSTQSSGALVLVCSLHGRCTMAGPLRNAFTLKPRLFSTKLSLSLSPSTRSIPCSDLPHVVPELNTRPSQALRATSCRSCSEKHGNPAGHRREEALAAGGTLTHGVNDAPTTSPFGRQYEYPTSAKTQ